jgi:hypothetical protein
VTASQLEEKEEELPTPTTGLSVVPELVEPLPPQEESRTEVINIVETETRTTFHVVDDVEEVIESTEIYSQEEVFEEEEVFDSFLDEESEVVEPAAEPEDKPVVQSSPIQSTSRWAEVLFGTKDEEEDK